MKNKKIIFIMLPIIFVCVLLTGCHITVPKMNRQTKVLDAKWQSEENDYGIDLNFTAFKEGGVLFGQISYNNKTENIVMSWGNLSVDIKKIDYYGNLLNSEYIIGHYKIIKSSKIKITFSYDYIFNDELKNKTITVSATPIDLSLYDVSTTTNVLYEREQKDITIYTFQNTRNFSYCTLVKDEVTTTFIIFWFKDEQKFFAKKLEDNVLSSEILFDGSYASDNQSLTLNLNENTFITESNLTFSMRNIEYYEHPTQVWYPSQIESL